jgi:acetylornithine deacetylase
MADWSHRPRYCIVGEPTLLRVAVGHKGRTALKAVCHGRAAHSAAPERGLNAIYLATDLIDHIRRRQTMITQSGARDAAYEVPYTTLHVGTIAGGTVLNIVPDRCEFEFEVRNIPADDPAPLLDDLRADAAAIARTAASVIELEIDHQYPALETPADSAVVELAAELTGNRERIKVGFGTEGGLFSGQLGIPTVICGPGSINQAHKPDEFIALDQLQRCDAMMDALLERLI